MATSPAASTSMSGPANGESKPVVAVVAVAQSSEVGAGSTAARGGSPGKKSGRSTQDETANSARESWETAYVFAFLNRFTDVGTDLKTALVLQTAMDLEQAVAEPGTVDDPNPAFDAVISTFCSALKDPAFHGKADKWLPAYVARVVRNEQEAPGSAILRWGTNKVAEKGSVYALGWKDRLHLLKVLVDHALTWSPTVREKVDDGYGLAKGKTFKARTTEENPLIVQSLGIDSEVKTWWQIDDSPRLYCSGNPHKPSCSWDILSSTRPELTSVVDTLARPEPPPPASEAGLAPIFKKKGKKAASSSSSTEQLERELRKRIETEVVPRLDDGEARIAGIRARMEKAAASEARRQAREQNALLQQIAAEDARETRGSRLRTQVKRPDYVVDSGMTDRQFEKQLRKYERGEDVDLGNGRPAYAEASDDEDRWDGDGGSSKGARKGRGKRRRGESDSEDWQDDLGGDEDDYDGGSRRSGRSSRVRKGRAKTPEWRGERRSSRIQVKKITERDATDSAGSEDEVVRPSSTWSRSRRPPTPPNEPQQPASSASASAPAPETQSGNVSVWSKGKLVYANGHNKYTEKAVSQQKKTFAKPGGGSVVVGGPGSAPEADPTLPNAPHPPTASAAATTGQTTGGGGGGLSALQKRLAAMDDGDSSSDDDDDHRAPKRPDRKVDGENGAAKPVAHAAHESISAPTVTHSQGGTDSSPMDLDS